MMVACENPLWAGMVTSPADYPWSSHRHSANGAPNDVVFVHEGYLALGHSDAARQRDYRNLFEALVGRRPAPHPPGGDPKSADFAKDIKSIGSDPDDSSMIRSRAKLMKVILVLCAVYDPHLRRSA